MKQFFLFLILSFFSFTATSQMVTDVFLGETIQIENIDIEFVELVSDSRCPKEVNCIRAGEAIVLANVYENGTFLEQRKLTFYASGISDERENTLLANRNINISGLNLEPYPKGLDKIRKEDYLLVLKVY